MVILNNRIREEQSYKKYFSLDIKDVILRI